MVTMNTLGRVIENCLQATVLPVPAAAVIVTKSGIICANTSVSVISPAVRVRMKPGLTGTVAASPAISSTAAIQRSTFSFCVSSLPSYLPENHWLKVPVGMSMRPATSDLLQPLISPILATLVTRMFQILRSASERPGRIPEISGWMVGSAQPLFGLFEYAALCAGLVVAVSFI
jgi:hypothetical protein